MENKKIMVLSAIVGAVALALGVSVGLLTSNKDALFDTKTNDVKESKKSESNETKDNEEVKTDVSNKETSTSKSNTTKNEVTQSNVSTNKETKSEENTQVSTNTTPAKEYSQNDNVVIGEMENTLNSINQSSNDSDFSDKAKATFVSLVDFLFYDGEIKGITFNELTTSGKEKVLELANKIDVKLEEKAPGYKDTISTSTKNAYNKASEVIKSGASNVNNFAKDKLGTDNYNSIVDAKDELVKYSKNALSLVKNSGSKLLTSTKDKLSNWYQNFKNK